MEDDALMATLIATARELVQHGRERTITVNFRKLDGEQYEPISTSSLTRVADLREMFRPQLQGYPADFCIGEHKLRPQEEIGEFVTEGVEFFLTAIRRENVLELEKTDKDTGEQTRLQEGARWQGATLVLASGSYVVPPWNFAPDLQQDFAVEVTVMLAEWPAVDYRGPIVSRHGWESGLELRIGGKGAVALLTTKRGDEKAKHTELLKTMPRTVHEWIHLCMYYEAPTSTLKLYLNGDRENCVEKQIQGRFIPYNGQLEVGRNPCWHDRVLSGSIRDLKIWPAGFDLNGLQERASLSLSDARGAI
ncbi:unnamed protein product [Symbiodinium sp. CCMP2592]|nr:unnamed protein product [Symbiodinium sp. CCMP2592]